MTGVAWPFNETGTSGAPAATSRQLRQLNSAFVAMGSAARPLGAKSGVRLGTPSSVVTISGSGTYTWSAGGFGGIIDGEANAAAGPYQYAFETADTGSITASGASARKDRLDVQISDSDEGDASGTKTVKVIYTQGAATGGAIPAAPARSHALGIINVPTSGAPTFSWAPEWCGGPGGWTFNTYAEMKAYSDALTATNVPVSQRATVLADTTTANNGDYVWTGAGWGSQQGGLVLMPPSGVVGTGVSATAGGGVSFTNATTVSLDDVFTSRFDHYLIVLSIDSISAAGTIGFKLRTAGHADSTVSTYSYMYQNITGTSAAQGFGNSLTSGTCSSGPSSAGQMLSTFDISNPAKALNKQWNGKCAVTDTGNGMTLFSGQIATATAFAGISFIASAGTITGNVRVYGYNNG